MRICKKCYIEKEDNEFRPDNKYLCKKCFNKYIRERYHNGYKEKQKIATAKYQKTDRGKLTAALGTAKYQKTEGGKISLRKSWRKYLSNDIVRDTVRNSRKLFRENNPLLIKIEFMLSVKRRLGMIVDTNREELYNKFKNETKCYICGCELLIEYSNGIHRNTLSFDRTGNSDIITCDNLVLVCCRCNGMKGDRDLNEYLEYMNNVRKKSFEIVKYNINIDFDGIDRSYKSNDKNRYYVSNWANRTIRDHIRRGYIINFSKNKLLNLYSQTPCCPICGCEMGRGESMSNLPSMDRIDNKTELFIDDVWVICHKCNTTKSDLTLIEFKEYADKVCKRFNYPSSPTTSLT